MLHFQASQFHSQASLESRSCKPWTKMPIDHLGQQNRKQDPQISISSTPIKIRTRKTQLQLLPVPLCYGRIHKPKKQIFYMLQCLLLWLRNKLKDRSSQRAQLIMATATQSLSNSPKTRVHTCLTWQLYQDVHSFLLQCPWIRTRSSGMLIVTTIKSILWKRVRKRLDLQLPISSTNMSK